MFEIVRRVSSDKTGMHTHYHNAYELVFIMSGEAQFTINGRQYRAQRGSMLFISNLETHMLSIEETPYERYYALISQDFFNTAIQDPVLSSMFRHRPAHFSHMVQLPEDAMADVGGLMDNMLREYAGKRDYWQESARCWLMQLFILLFRRARDFFPLRALNRTTEAIIAIQKHIEEHCEEEFTLAQAARQSFIEMHYLSKLFKEVTGFTFQQYLILQRISRAKGLLLGTEDSVMKTGASSGFHNASHFIRMFKTLEGVTPSQYRKMARQKE